MGLTGLLSVDLYAEENAAMNTFPRDVEPGVESQLVDLGAVPLAVLRELDGTAIRRSLLHVVEQTGYPRANADQGGAERID
jgi:hypothetical protein